MEYMFYTNEAVLNMKESPLSPSKVISQTTFAEKVTIQGEDVNQLYITTPDGYSGWVPKASIFKRKTPYKPSLMTSRLISHIYNVKDTEYGPIKTLPYNTPLQALDNEDPRWIKIILPDEQEAYIQKGDVALESPILHKECLSSFSQKFLGLPYTWGGRSSFGYDCSGFIQMLYGKIGINLPRDSKEQILDPRFKKIEIKDIKPGDLIFWGKSKMSISHVGMSLGEGKFIHSVSAENQPWIRISYLSDPGWVEKATARPYREILQLIEK
ncbi:MAG: C40 family peptidase [Verrucomicrobia bacterium]|nr:C40 family peptidase [Verrucomicrobiota bacterium]